MDIVPESLGRSGLKSPFLPTRIVIAEDQENDGVFRAQQVASSGIDPERQRLLPAFWNCALRAALSRKGRTCYLRKAANRVRCQVVRKADRSNHYKVWSSSTDGENGPMTPDYEQLFAECLADIDKPLPKNCAQRGWPQSKNCRLVGGCPACYAELLTGCRRGLRKELARAKPEKAEVLGSDWRSTLWSAV